MKDSNQMAMRESFIFVCEGKSNANYKATTDKYNSSEVKVRVRNIFAEMVQKSGKVPKPTMHTSAPLHPTTLNHTTGHSHHHTTLRKIHHVQLWK